MSTKRKCQLILVMKGKDLFPQVGPVSCMLLSPGTNGYRERSLPTAAAFKRELYPCWDKGVPLRLLPGLQVTTHLPTREKAHWTHQLQPGQRGWGRGGQLWRSSSSLCTDQPEDSGALSDFPGSLLCPCIYRKRRSGKSQGRDQNTFLGCIVDNTLFLNKGKEAEKATGRRGERGWHAASPAAHWTQAKRGASLWRILPRGGSLNPLIRMFSLGVHPIQGHRQPVIRVLSHVSLVMWLLT